MKAATCIGRVGALAVTLGVGIAGAAAPGVAVAEAAESADSTALIMCGTTCPTPDDTIIEVIKNQYIAPTHPGQDIDYVAVTTPEEAGPFTGIARLLCLVLGDPRVWGLGGPGWPDVPLWKLSGLFDLTLDQSVEAGVADLEAAMAEHGNDHLVIYGISQSAVIANVVKRKLAEQYPAGTDAPDIDFVLSGDPNLPNGGQFSRLAGLSIPILGWTFNGAEPTDTQFDTVVITRQYDQAADFPLYPINLVSVVNSVLGFVYLHSHSFDVSLPPDPTTSPAYQGTHGDTSYYFFETQNLPLFDPLRTLGMPEALIDVVEPFFRVIVELGYDRSIPPWEPTPARLIPILDPAKVITDIVSAIGEGINNAGALVGLPKLLSIPAPDTPAAPAADAATADTSRQATSTDTPTQTGHGTSTGAATGARQMSADTTESTTVTDPPTSGQIATDTEQPTPPAHVTEITTTPSTAADASEQSASPTPEGSATNASTRRPAKSDGQPMKPRSVVRDSRGVDRQLPDRSRGGEDKQPSTPTGAADADATSGEISSTAASSASSSTSLGASDDSDGS